MEEDGHITVIWQDNETARKAMIISELWRKTASEVYRDVINDYFHDVVTNMLITYVSKFECELSKYGVNLPDGVYLLIEGQRLSEAASMIAEAVKKIPRLQAAQPLISKGNRIVGILSI
jgi:hypothetical protein